MYQDVDTTEMLGHTMKSVQQIDDEELVFLSEDGTQFRFFHAQDCCEDVHIADIIGDLHDLEGTPILRAEERTDEFEEGEYDETGTWTFYEFATIKGSVTVRWLGTSNGYYSESVDLCIIKPGQRHE